MKKQTTIHLSFTKKEDDQALFNEILSQSENSYVSAATIVRENLKIIMKQNNGSLALQKNNVTPQ